MGLLACGCADANEQARAGGTQCRRVGGGASVLLKTDRPNDTTHNEPNNTTTNADGLFCESDTDEQLLLNILHSTNGNQQRYCYA